MPLNASWGGALESLSHLALTNAGLSGSLPREWALAMLNMENLTLAQNTLSGSIPAEWTQRGAFPELRVLQVNGGDETGTVGLTGPLPGASCQLSKTSASGFEMVHVKVGVNGI